MEQKALSVTQINEYIRKVLDRDDLLTSVAVVGELSNYKIYPSGHHYFTLKDEGAALKCVMFKGNTFRLRFRPDNGMKVIVMGKISVYPKDGAYQLYCTAMVPSGVGDLHAAFEQLKTKLSAQGLFDPDHKKQIPAYPGVIGIITSSAGAAVHDMIRILKKRYPLTRVRLLPVKVQGEDAPPEIADAIRYANHFKIADLLIVGRGGGSLEDLWAFNDERVARAIYESQIPVISAVGHEPDVTISDYVADLRAATPSNAAELAVPDANALQQVLDSYQGMLAVALRRALDNNRRHLSLLAASPALQSPEVYIKQRRDALSHLTLSLGNAQSRLIEKNRRSFISAVAKLDAMSPLKVLTRGYSVAQKEDGAVIREASQVADGDRITIRVSDGKFTAEVKS